MRRQKINAVEAHGFGVAKSFENKDSCYPERSEGA